MGKEEFVKVHVGRCAGKSSTGILVRVAVSVGALFVLATGLAALVCWHIWSDEQSTDHMQRFVGVITLHGPWNPRLADNNSTESLELETLICAGLSDAVSYGSENCDVTLFEPGSIKAHFTVDVVVNRFQTENSILLMMREGTFVDGRQVVTIEVYVGDILATNPPADNGSSDNQDEDQAIDEPPNNPIEESAYQVDWTSDPETLTVTIVGRTRGWVGFGVSGTGGMRHADMLVAWVDDMGAGHVLDTYSEENAAPVIDPSSQDWQLLEASEDDEYTRVKVRRFLRLCDPANRNITSGTQKVIWALGASDPASETSLGGADYHGSQRGTMSRRLLDPPRPPQTLPEDAIGFDFLQDNFTIPSDADTTYWCRIIDVPEFVDQYHYIAFEPLIQAGNEPFVHHITLFYCDPIPEPLLLRANGSDCSLVGGIYRYCGQIASGWAVGGQTLHYPQHTSQPVGGADRQRTFMLETHYDNAHMEQGVVDSSGLRLWVTPSPRQYNASMILLGAHTHPIQIVPPRMQNFITTAHCTERCINEGLKDTPEGIHVFAAFLHTHLAGTSVVARHFRNGTELPPIAKDMTYDFNYQNTVLLGEEVPVLPGDRIVVECGYNTEDRENVTHGGLSTHDEMCTVFLYYYPEISVIQCASLPTVEQLVTSIDGSDIHWDQPLNEYVFTAPQDIAGVPVMGYLDLQLRNDVQFAHKLQQANRGGGIYDFCSTTSSFELETITVSGIENFYSETMEGICHIGLP